MRRRKISPRSPRRSKEPFLRPPAVAGIFYPEGKEALAGAVERSWSFRGRLERFLAAIVPHGGIQEAGPVAGAVYSMGAWPSRVIVIGPDHAGVLSRPALMKEGIWETPMGRLPVDERIAGAILERLPEIEENADAHRQEHGIELQIPFLQRAGRVKAFVPILLGPLEFSEVRRIGEGIAEVIRKAEEPVGLIATANLARYEPKEAAQEEDCWTVERILALDGAGLLAGPGRGSSSMCGAPAVAAVLEAAKGFGGSRAALVSHSIAGEGAGEDASVVGFAGITVHG